MSGLTLEQLEEDLKVKLGEQEQIANEHNAHSERVNQLKNAFTEKQGQITQLQSMIERMKGDDE